MKKILFTASAMLIGLFCFGQQAMQIKPPYIDKICYQEKTTELVSFEHDIDVSKFKIQDKILSRKKSITQNINKYFDQDLSVVLDYQYLKSESYFPPYYTPPYLIRKSKEGMKSFFKNDNSIYGWPGANENSKQLGFYHDKRKDERYFHKPFEKASASMFKTENQVAQSYGFLYDLIFRPPSEEVLRQFDSSFSITSSSDFVIVKNEDMELTWDFVSQKFIQSFFSEGILTKTITIFYEYNSQFEEYIIKERVTMIKKYFSTGDCYNQIQIKEHSNYSIKCSSVSRESQKENDPLLTDLSVYPNPANETVNIEQDSNTFSSCLIEIKNTSGQVLVARKMNTHRLTINIADWPKGVYLITSSNAKTNSTKFIKI